MRLDKFLSQATSLSRSQVRRLIRCGRVAVKDDVVRDPTLQISAGISVHLDGAKVAAYRSRYFMLYKPLGVVCAHHDGLHRTVFSLLHEPQLGNLHLAGRLDLDASGLVLITDDGQWSHRVTAPRHKAAKSYVLDLAEPLDEAAAEQLRCGLPLRGETKPTAPAEVEIVSACRCRLTLREGRYHQVKRMLAAVGNHVTALHRERIGSIELDSSLAPGQYRALTANEIAEFSTP